MMERRERRVCSGNLAMSMPSMMMRPAWRPCYRGGTMVLGLGPQEDAGEDSDCRASRDV